MPIIPDRQNDFAVAMYRELRERPGNLFFSPFSIRTALAMTQAGARGETASQMREALGISSETAGFAETVQRLTAAGDGTYEIAVANSLWSQDGVLLLPDYVDLIAQHYGGNVNLVDFHRAAEAARATINQWVEDKTRQKIRELVPPSGVDALTRLVLVNAIYFKGTWVLQFQKAITRDAPFHVDRAGTVQVPLMHQQEEIRYMQAAGFQGVELPYQGDDLAMLVLLPDRNEGLRDLEEMLSASMLQRCIATMRVRDVKLFLPRFRITWGTVDLRDQLMALGIPLAFTSQADFSGINGHMPGAEDSLFISAVFHKAFVEVNEEGTEAAAATAVLMRVTMSFEPSEPPPVPVFRADHPFLFAIRDRKSNEILFLGRITDPTRES